MASQIQPSFSSGEITRSAFGRIDLAKYGSGLKTLRNMITKVHGGVVNRPGTEFVCEVKDSSIKGRLIPFEFSTAQSYVLALQNLSMQVVKDGGLVLEANKTITATTNATPVVVTSNGHGYANGNRVFITGTGLASIDNRFWILANIAANTFELAGSTAPGATSSTGTVARVFDLTTPYTTAQLPTIKYTQLADVMTLTHNEVKPKDLSRSDHAAWTLSDMAFEQGPFQDQNVDKTKLMQASAATGAGVVITATGHAPFLSTHVGMLIYLEQKDYGVPWEVGKSVLIGDIRRAEGKYYRAVNAATTGTLRPSHDNDTASDGTVDWLYVHNGYGIALITGFTDSTHVTVTVLNELPAPVVSATTYKWALGAWGGDQGWPGSVVYFQQRRALASTPKQPQKIWMSGTDAYTFFGKSAPIADDDSLSMTLASNQINAIRHMISFGKLVIFTSGGKWVLPDDDNNPILTPVKRSARQQGSIGASEVRPVIVEDTVLYGAAKGETVHDLAYQFASNAYAGTDLSVLSKHLLEARTIVGAAYQHVPFQVYWAVRDDGALIGMTYLKAHEVWGWHRHDTGNGRGWFEDACAISEGGEDRVYFLVRRTINGQTKRYIERLASRLYTDVKDCKFLDSCLTYDGRNKGATTMTLSGGTTWANTETLTLTASAAFFAAAHVGTEIHYEAVDGLILKLTITAFTSTTVVSVKSNRTVAVAFRGTATTAWGHARKTVTGLGHLEAETVSILADAHVHPQLVVTGGAITLQYAAVVIHAGLPIEADFETLNINLVGAGSALEKQKNTFAVRVMVDESRGIFAGRDFEPDHLMEYAQRADENYDEPVRPFSGIVSQRIPSTWEPGGRICIRQSDPLPLSILAVMPDLDVGNAK
jgi:hypothetical protein